jgi:hypothetical protein
MRPLPGAPIVDGATSDLRGFVVLWIGRCASLRLRPSDAAPAVTASIASIRVTRGNLPYPQFILFEASFGGIVVVSRTRDN